MAGGTATDETMVGNVGPDGAAGGRPDGRRPPGRAAEHRGGWRSGTGPWTVVVVGVALLVASPVLVVLGHVFVDSGGVWSHLAATVLPDYVANSLLLMVGVGICTLLLGVCSAWLVTLCRFPGAGVFEWALLLPMAVPAYVIAYTYTGLTDFAGPVQAGLRAVFGWQSARDYWFPAVRSLPGAVVMMSLVLYPYVYMLCRAAFLEQSVCVLEASRVLGRGPWRSFATVALPLARPAVAAGVALALMETLNDFGTVHFFAIDTFTTGIYRTWLNLGQPAAAAQLGAVLMLFILALVVVERLSRGRARFHHTTGRYRQLPRYRLTGVRAALAMAGCLLPVAAGFLVPAAVLLAWAVDTAPTVVDGRFLALAGNSFVLAALAAALAVVVGLLLGYGQRLHPSRLVAVAVRVASLGYAVPGAVIAVGTLVPLAALDTVLAGWLRSAFGVNAGLLITGSVAALTFAYLVRFLAVAFGTLETSLQRVTASMEGAARTLGAGPLSTLRRVHVPIIRPSLFTAALLVFVDVMKELPATVIMRPFNFDTLAVRAFDYASDERLREAAVPALAIVAVGIVPVMLMSRAIAAGRPGSNGKK